MFLYYKMFSELKDKFMAYIPYDYTEKLTEYTSGDNLYIILLIIYSAFVSMYSPRSIINLINQPVARILILGLILYVATYNIILAIFIAIAFIITVSIDSSISINKANLKPIYDFDSEGFVGNDDKDDNDDDEDVKDVKKDNKNKSKSTKIDTDSNDENEDFETNSNNDDNDKKDEDEDFEGEMAKNSNLNDAFKNLHNAIHKLESFVSAKKQ